MAKSVMCIARTENQAIDIVNRLEDEGFSNNDISVLLPDRSGTRDFAHERHTKAPEGASAGVLVGGLLGGLLGWLVAAGVLVIPGIGQNLASHPLMFALSGAAVGALAGGLAGAAIGAGFPEYEAKRYEGKIRDGNILISVHSDSAGQRRLAMDIFTELGATGVAVMEEKHVKPDRRRRSRAA